MKGMTPFRTRVKENAEVHGIAALDGAALRIPPGIYTVQRLSRPRPGRDDFEGAVRFHGVDKRHAGRPVELLGVDLWVADSPELNDCSTLPLGSVFELA